jgi:hypothetical protein
MQYVTFDRIEVDTDGTTTGFINDKSCEIYSMPANETESELEQQGYAKCDAPGTQTYICEFDEWFEANCVKLIDYIGYQDFADFAGVAYISAQRWVQADQRSEEIAYSEAEAIEIVNKMKQEFRRAVVPQETIAGKTARLTGLELVGEDSHTVAEVW